MIAVILAGGKGTRLSEETHIRPKPMIEVGGKPILWHIMKIFASHGITDFVICGGYKGYMIKEYFSNYYVHMSDVTFDLSDNTMKVHHERAEPWKVTVVDTGVDTMTGGRLKAVKRFLSDEAFCFTYGDGVADVDIGKLIEFHRTQQVTATVTAVQPPGRFGLLNISESSHVSSFEEKPVGDGGWINGGFFVLEPEAIDYIESSSTLWEREPLERLAAEGNLAAFRHRGFWHPMDTLRDKELLEDLWDSESAPWKVW